MDKLDDRASNAATCLSGASIERDLSDKPADQKGQVEALKGTEFSSSLRASQEHEKSRSKTNDLTRHVEEAVQTEREQVELFENLKAQRASRSIAVQTRRSIVALALYGKDILQRLIDMLTALLDSIHANIFGQQALKQKQTTKKPKDKNTPESGELEQDAESVSRS